MYTHRLYCRLGKGLKVSIQRWLSNRAYLVQIIKTKTRYMDTNKRGKKNYQKEEFSNQDFFKKRKKHTICWYYMHKSSFLKLLVMGSSSSIAENLCFDSLIKF